jgi:site-specific recombinase XerD
MNIQFYIDKKDQPKSVIMLSISDRSERLRISTRISVSPKDWSDAKKKLKPSAESSAYINKYLTDLVNKINAAYFDAKNNGSEKPLDDVKKEVKKFLDPKLFKERLRREPGFFDVLDKFIKERADDPNYKHKTIKHYTTILNHLKAFEKSRKKKIEFDDIDKEFYDELTKYLINKKKLKTNSVGTVMRITKTFLFYCLRNDYMTNTKFMDAFKVPWKDAQTVSLTEKELDALMNVELDERLDNVRNLFVIQILTGLRYSDLKNLKQENIDFENEIIKISMIKTEDSVIIPISSKLRGYLEKYVERKLHVMYINRYNNYIKDVCQKAGIDTPVQNVWFYGKKRVEEVKPKYELISSHTARRTFITLSLQKGALPEQVMKVSGHKDRKSFQKYVKVDQQEAINKIKDIWE